MHMGKCRKMGSCVLIRHLLVKYQSTYMYMSIECQSLYWAIFQPRVSRVSVNMIFKLVDHSSPLLVDTHGPYVGSHLADTLTVLL